LPYHHRNLTYAEVELNLMLPLKYHSDCNYVCHKSEECKCMLKHFRSSVENVANHKILYTYSCMSLLT